MGATKLMTAAGGGVTLDAASTATDKTITVPADNGTLVYANSSGNVGIGTSSPSTKLHVLNTSAGGGIRIDSGASNFSTLSFASNGTVYGLQGVATASGDLVSGSAAGDLVVRTASKKILFTVDNGTSIATTIDSSGNLLVGTTTVSGRGTFYRDPGTNCSLAARTDANGYLALDCRNASSGQAGFVYVNASSVNYNTTSDYRLKENVQPMIGALSVVQQLHPVTYTWKEDGSDGQGFIAHELQSVVPDAVTGEKDAVDENGNPVYQGIDTSFLVATLTAAIQELKAELDAAKADIAALKGTQ